MTLITVWQGVGSNMIIFLAALQNMPAQVYEAAKLDGAGPITVFFRMTVPAHRAHDVFYPDDDADRRFPAL